ncbi:trna-splicing endonuclease subunit sen15 [Trichoderma cornu-damae]|uniref:Trna-splicing endonuclease subunit sen15 n=1 Tax=Trichoderma cornu-damae TaxID=654480 RepID=A0A9P8QTD8_9HYPO|nr:trna-splicing endonuclease subunit sen15 [Trichoderma cornu-damae]
MDVSPHHDADVACEVFRNLQDQHQWTSLEIHAIPGLPRPMIRGLPPRLLYLHPDDQIAALAYEKSTGTRAQHDAEFEWVLAVHLAEKWTLSNFAAVMDAVPEARKGAKRIVLAALHNDSTVVYYIVQEGMVKPRQN